MGKSKTKKLKTVNEKTMIVAIDIGKSIHHGYFRGSDGQDIKPFQLRRLQRSSCKASVTPRRHLLVPIKLDQSSVETL